MQIFSIIWVWTNSVKVSSFIESKQVEIFWLKTLVDDSCNNKGLESKATLQSVLLLYSFSFWYIEDVSLMQIIASFPSAKSSTYFLVCFLII